MKTNKIVISAVAIIIYFMTQSFAGPTGKDTTTKESAQIQHFINKAITYPDFAKSSKLEGFVLVQYQINQSGNIKVDAINGSNKQLMSYVQSQLSKLNVPLGEIKNLYAKFIFKLY
jgi:hypothetical protein